MRLFVSEFLTGGGLCAEPLPPDLLRDAHSMFDGLVADLRRIDDLEIITTRDVRLGPVAESIATIRSGDDPWIIWAECLRGCDAVWITAPESGGILLALRHLAAANGCRFIGCDVESIRTTTSKSATARHFAGEGIRCIESRGVFDPPPSSDTGWVIKPDDGAGCEETRYFSDAGEIETWKVDCTEPGRYVIQPLIEGRHASLSVIYSGNHCEVLACNEQDIVFRNGRVHAQGVHINRFRERLVDMLPVAEAIGRAMPGLNGFVGIDFIDTHAGPVLVEINPRLTTAYAGLRDILDFNPAERILRSFGCLTEVTDPVTL